MIDYMISIIIFGECFLEFGYSLFVMKSNFLEVRAKRQTQKIVYFVHGFYLSCISFERPF